ncbi:MAG: hypothetical protein K8R85_05755 [Bacteroidetes bacterium]|nr:hypothetical protein [Bacteroidota bacterium]
MQKKIKKFIRDKGVYAAMIMIVCGCISIPLLFWFTSVIVIGIGSIFFMFFGCGLLGLFQWKYVKDHIEMAYNQFAMYAFIGFGMCLLNFILLLNYSISIAEHSETYTISRKGYYNEIIIGGGVQNRALERNLNTYIGEHMDDASFDVNKVRITFETGLFGFDKISNCEFN